MKPIHKVVHIGFVAGLLAVAASSKAMAEPAPIPTSRSLLTSHSPAILIDGRPQTLTFTLGSEETRKEFAGVNTYSKRCEGVSSTGVTFTYDCSAAYSYTRDAHVADVSNRVTVVIPEAASRFGSLNEVLDIFQDGSAVFVAANRSSKRVLIYARADTKTIRRDSTSKVLDLETTVYVQFADFAQVTRPVTEGMSDFAVDGRYFSYRIGRVTDPSLLQVEASVEVLTPPFFGNKILRRPLDQSEFFVKDEGDFFSRIIIDLDKLRLVKRMRGKRVMFRIGTALNVPQAGLANDNDLPRLSMYKEWESPKLDKKLCPDCE